MMSSWNVIQATEEQAIKITQKVSIKKIKFLSFFTCKFEVVDGNELFLTKSISPGLKVILHARKIKEEIFFIRVEYCNSMTGVRYDFFGSEYESIRPWIDKVIAYIKKLYKEWLKGSEI